MEPNIKAVVFDMDGLMFDTERLVQKSWDIAGEKLGYGPLGHNILNTLGTNLVNRRKYFIKTYGGDFPFEKFLKTYRKAYYELSKDGAPAKEGLHEVLEVIKKKGLKIALATSSSRNHALGNLERENIRKYFDVIITGDMISRGKPEPDIYIKACEMLEVKPKQAIALEDAINGIKSANGAGMHVIMIPDIITETKEVDHMLFGKYDSLLRVAEYIREKE